MHLRFSIGRLESIRHVNFDSFCLELFSSGSLHTTLIGLGPTTTGNDNIGVESIVLQIIRHELISWAHGAIGCVTKAFPSLRRLRHREFALDMESTFEWLSESHVPFELEYVGLLQILTLFAVV